VLVLARRVNEQLVINGEIVVTVLGIGRNGQVRLGITAPPQVQIFRHELWLEIQAENRKAAAPPTASADDALGRLLGDAAHPASVLDQE
jgi:carbon storage regulator